MFHTHIPRVLKSKLNLDNLIFHRSFIANLQDFHHTNFHLGFITALSDVRSSYHSGLRGEPLASNDDLFVTLPRIIVAEYILQSLLELISLCTFNLM